MKKTISAIAIFFLSTLTVNAQAKKIEFEPFLNSLKNFHEDQIETFTSETSNPNTFPILFAIGKEEVKQKFQRLDLKDSKVKQFIKQYNQIEERIKNIEDYIEFGNMEFLTLIENTLPPLLQEFIGEREKINKIYWQMGDSTNWPDCPVNLTYHELLKTEICAMNYDTALRYCKQYDARLPTTSEFSEAYKNKKEIMTNGRWMKYWTATMKNGNPQHITITEQFGTTIDGNSLSSVRCVWDKIK